MSVRHRPFGCPAIWRVCALEYEEPFLTSLLVGKALLHGGVVLHILGFRKILRDFRFLTNYSPG